MIKRSFDFIVSLSAILILMPVIIILWAIVFKAIGSPVLFTQPRPGKGGKVFRLYKFRTMTNEKDQFGNLLPDEQRLTGFGKFLRSTSLDELPSLLNVVKGELSLVGPRPLLVEYMPLYNSSQARRHEVRPGVTGWAQVNGRNAISWEQKFDFDVWYVDNQSFLLDIKILLMTVLKVVKKSDISPENEEIMPRFTGTAASGVNDDFRKN